MDLFCQLDREPWSCVAQTPAGETQLRALIDAARRAAALWQVAITVPIPDTQIGRSFWNTIHEIALKIDPTTRRTSPILVSAAQPVETVMVKSLVDRLPALIEVLNDAANGTLGYPVPDQIKSFVTLSQVAMGALAAGAVIGIMLLASEKRKR